MADLSSYINITANVVISNTVSSNSVVSTTGNVNAGNITVSGIASVTGNVTANYFLGNGSLLSGISSSYGNANVVANLAALGSNPVSTTGNVTSGNISTSGLITATGNISGNYFVGNGSQLTGLAASYGNSNVSTFLAAYGSNTVSTTGNITSGNILTSELITATGNIQGGNIRTAGLISATGNVTGGNLLTAGLSSATGNITTSGNVSATGNVYGNTFVGNGSGLTSVAQQTTGSWTLAPGVNSLAFTVTPGLNYSMWVNGNIPNGIVMWNATVSLSNTNVPVVGTQYGWYYAAGNALVLTSIPPQIVGTAGGISTATVVTIASNIFEFNITNNSGSSQTVYWGYTTL